ncbi:hypothetical protein KSS87_019680 [Heliosperma pusillum]|nr:hypothetical protein KSS87_019680 [Heliosperma pusillum]
MSPPQENGNATSSLHENGSSDSLSLVYSEKAVQEILEQPLQGIDEHLLEFSEAMRTVTKALRRAAEGKASAQAEAAEWKPMRVADTADFPEVGIPANGHCCGKNGICNHEILQKVGASRATSKRESANGNIRRKASFELSWNEGENGNQYKHDVVSFERGNISTTERSSKQIFLKWVSRPQTVIVLTKPDSTSVRLLCSELVRWLKEQKKLHIFVEPRVQSELLDESSYFSFVQTWENDREFMLLNTKVDLVVTLGGDGTVLWAASLFKGPSPPIVPFSMGSLGFMTPFYSEHFKESLDSVIQGPISITLRYRLQCHVIREAAKHEFETEEPILVLNEVTIDRGISSYLTNLECYCDDTFVTCVQGDGLILSTTSGSTAYSLAAGGSMVHPQVPGILFTPICPHSLSFRPLILPEHVTMRVQVASNSRGPAWVSFDGKDRKQLTPGDALICSIAPWPVPTACQGDSTGDFLRSIHEGLHWNLRKTQSFDGPDFDN